MTLNILLLVGVILSVIFHFIGVYAGAKKIVWIVIGLMWAGAISIAMSEIKPKGYEAVKKMQGKYKDTDKIIEEAGDEISIYEIILIKKSFLENEKR
ncbi:hypothetical protein MNB_SV-15-446 [hydrothermal vent metagenome]|uniref:Uncharacterized protein n=1 Tax=hydrothermal vent metagenome TaxID=652676 RepID=A0A1W1EIY3_9ZZZZ